MIFVTLGTMHLGFPRLVRQMDEVAAETKERVVIQIGHENTATEHCEQFSFRPRDEMSLLIEEARVVVTHAGIGSVIDVMKAGRPLVVVPRLKRFGEHNTDHQLDLARAVERRGWGRMVLEVDELNDLCATPRPPHAAYRPAKDSLIASVREAIGELTS